jgi:DNA-binding winged helix-turn-helix (wHTH) protein
LSLLLQDRERVVSKDDLLASVWSGRIVSNATLDSRIAAARRVVGDSGGAQTLIRTFARKGVRFVGEVREEDKPARLRRKWRQLKAPLPHCGRGGSSPNRLVGEGHSRGFAKNSRRIGV